MSNSISVGDVFFSNDGSLAEVVEYIRYSQIKVRFKDSFACEKIVSGKSLKNGSFKNPYIPSVHGVGFLGDGKFSSITKKGKDPAYVKWVCMMARCYGSRNVSCYVGVTVCDLWHNFQNFAEWFYSQKAFNLDWELDKDLVNGPLKQYSPDNCCLLPKKINRFLTGKRSKDKIEPAGVTLDPRRGRGYSASSYTFDGKMIRLGRFSTVEEAFLAYADHKKNSILVLANLYSSELCERAYQALVNFKVRRV